MKTEFRKMTVPLLFCVMIFGLSGGAMTLNVSFTKSVTASDNVYVAYLGNTITLNATVTPSISGEPDGEYTGSNETIEYRWFVDNELTSEERNTIDLRKDEHGITSYGQYTIRCEARYSLTYNNGNSIICSFDEDWFLVGERTITFFILEFQDTGGAVISSLAVKLNQPMDILSVLKPAVQAEIILFKSDDNISASYTIPGTVHITGTSLGEYYLLAKYRGQAIKKFPIKVANYLLYFRFVP